MMKKRSGSAFLNIIAKEPQGTEKGSVAFEYVIVTIFGVGLSLLIMSTAKKMISDKLDQFKATIEHSLIIPNEEGEDEPW